MQPDVSVMMAIPAAANAPVAICPDRPLMPTSPLHYQNQLLAALPEEERRRLGVSLELVPLDYGQCLYEPGAQILDVFFPTTAIVSLLSDIEDGTTAETAAVGNEGIVGVTLFMGGETTLSRAMVYSPGHGYKLTGRILKGEFHRAGPLQRSLMRYTQALLAEMAQTLVCMRHHTLEQQFCRWLLRRFDRLSPQALVMSQEMIAQVLGVRRAAISEVAIGLRTAGLISYGRGRVNLLDRPGLEARSCACYAAIQGEFARLLPGGTGT